MTDLDDPPPRPSRATRGLRITVRVLFVLTVAGLVWSRFLVEKQPLGGPCSWAVHCSAEAPTCMRPDLDAPGVCSRTCEAGTDCAAGIRCLEVELDERDDRGARVKAGTCVPQAYLDARRAKRDAGASQSARDGAAGDSWLDVPEAPGQLEAEIVLQTERGAARSKAKAKAKEQTILVKGPLVRLAGGDAAPRRIVDTRAMRVFVVDDARARFHATALGGAADGVTVTKTEQKDRVADHACELWELRERGARRDVCIVHGASFADPADATAPAWLRELAARSAFPLRVVERDASGRETSRTTAVRVEAKPLARALFAVPRAYGNAAAH